MDDLSSPSRISLYAILALFGLYLLGLWVWQVMVLRGRSMTNPDGSHDDWHEQKIFFGMALADIILACPVGITGIILIFVSPQWGHYLLTMVAFWFVWTNTMTTATSLRFEKPRITVNWLVTFPSGIIVGLAYIAWTVFHFSVAFGD